MNVYLMVNTLEGRPLGDWYHAYQPNQQFSPHLRIAGLKILIDYDSGRRLTWEQDELNQFVSQRHSEGWQIAIKAIGIQSHELALNAYQYALGGQRIYQHRHRIEHSLAVNDAQIATMAQMGIIASIEPAFPAVIWHEEDIRNLGQEQDLKNMFRWREYMDSGVFLVASTYNPPGSYGSGPGDEYFGSSHLSPMGVIYRGVTQIGQGGRQPESWMLERALTVEELLPMLTINGAYATFEEDIKGSLTPGKWADLVILSESALAVPAKEIPEIEVLMTMLGGQVEYCADPQAALCLLSSTVSTPAFSAACGRWVATDHDGSSMTLQVIRNPDHSFSIVMIDEDATACRKDSGSQEPIALQAEGRGTAKMHTLNLRGVEGICKQIGRTISFDIGLTYDRATDTLLDSYGIRWHRE